MKVTDSLHTSPITIEVVKFTRLQFAECKERFRETSSMYRILVKKKHMEDQE
jgi:hypothetical protein